MNFKFKNIIYIFLFFLFFYFINYYKNKIENFDNNKLIILLGDSILNNSNYVPKDFSVYDYIKKINLNTYLFAEDGAKLFDLDKQIEKLSKFEKEEINNKNCYIFISIIGNNILENKKNNFKILNELFEKYFNKIKNLKLKYPKSNIFLLNLYKPLNNVYSIYYEKINYWNCVLRNNNENYYEILDINKLITDKNDLIYNIEPSVKGGKKIANKILEKIN